MAAISRMKEIHRVFEYHGAEHKTIACYEAGDPLTVANVRKYTRFHPCLLYTSSENVQVEELLRAPRLPGDYGALQNALNEWLGESAQLKYPMQGELLSPCLLYTSRCV